VDGDFFTPGEPTEPRLHLLYAGRLLPHKGIDRVISVLPRHIRMVVCGRPYHDDYFHLLERLAKGKDVEFVTDADDAQLRSLYRHAWATVLPSVYRDYYGTTYQQPELMGLTVLESMACGTPVIVSDVGALPEFVDHGVTGLVTSGLDALEEAIVTLYSRRGTALQMGLAARQQVSERYAMDNVARRIGALYDQELARAGTGDP
jgi:glycosyltransferase involved in cell wall biosynthesis